MRLIRVVKDVVGVGPSTEPEPGSVHEDATEMAVKRTDLALKRTYNAAERTLMAWIRTTLSMISFGFTLGKLREVLDSETVKLGVHRMTDIEGVAYWLVIVGTLALIAAAVQNRIEVAGLFRMGLTRRPSLAFFVSLLLSLLGIFAFTDLVTRL